MSLLTGPAADFLLAGESALGLLGHVGVVQQWTGPSALPEMSVGALATHLGQQVLMVHAAVVDGRAVSDRAPVPLLEHYGRVAWVGAGLHDEANLSTRTAAEHASAAGHDQLVRAVDTALEDLRQALGRQSAQLPAGITMPWWDWTLSFEDFLTTRVMEIVVHSDDLAVSVDAPTPLLPDPVLGPVLALLVGVALQRHGQTALVRALTRRERAPETIAAF